MDLCFILTDNLGKMSPTVMCKAKLISGGVDYTEKEISKQSIEGGAFILFSSLLFSKVRD